MIVKTLSCICLRSKSEIDTNVYIIMPYLACRLIVIDQ